jgi:hypothetical protein
MSAQFSTWIGWMIGFLLLPLTQALRLVGLLLPPCSSLSLFRFSDNFMNGIAQWIRFAWPFLQFFPWDVLWALLSACLLYLFFKFLWNFVPTLLHMGPVFWIVIAFFYIMAFALNFFLGDTWINGAFYETTMGVSPTSTYSAGGGGWGVGSW